MKNYQIELPKSIKDLRMYHLEAIARSKDEHPDVYEKLRLFCELTGTDMELAKRVSIAQVNEVNDHYFQLIHRHKLKDPPNNTKVDGKHFTRVKRISDQPTAWHIDISHFGTDADKVAAFCYLEKGMEYCEMDKQKNVLNPITPRAELFKEHLSADVHIELGFFLQKKFEGYRSAYTEIKKQRRKLVLKLEQKENRMNGKKESTQSTENLDSAGKKLPETT